MPWVALILLICLETNPLTPSFSQLPADTLAALREFNEERDLRAKQFAALQDQAESDFSEKPFSMEAFSEDWNASQFWYRDETAKTLARALLENANHQTRIGVVSAPSVFSTVEASERPMIVLLEYDERFGVFKQEFVHYDFQQPLKLPVDLKGSFDRLICDPPFLSEDCQTKAALTVRWLCRSWSSPSQSPGDYDGQRILVCTGERMQSVVEKLYGKAGVRTTTFDVRHAKGLSNEFRCYANFENDQWKWR
ncbi:hypothetical protein EV356DRAFT_539433 [Viridothelium virens]|uniref:Protein-lysine N-methyltransferase EFM5 n=1 Tax=Viridothelium virens TaxID=1048519 RepID=A0A6A6HH76_VIRVR|nr:hypothetical protein EV356DRAFT_539433 [Viridothelium virens]